MNSTRLFVVGVALIALHVIDDSFVQPQPGTSAADHLVSGLVPLALLALAAWAYPRLRGGRRGATRADRSACSASPPGSRPSTTSARSERPGDDYTGLLAIPAGLLLLGVGVVDAVADASRRTAACRADTCAARCSAPRASSCSLYVVLPVGMSYVDTHTARAVVPAANLGVPYEQVSFDTSDGLTLSGWYVPSRNGAAVIAFPGRKGPQAHTRMLARHGYGVLLFDRRGEGESEGDPTSWGWGNEKDIKAGIAFLQRRADVDPERIGGLGLSVGGEMMIQTAAETDALKAVASEGAGMRSVREAIDSPPSADKWLGVPFKAVETAATAVFHDQMPPANLGDLVAQGRAPSAPAHVLRPRPGRRGTAQPRVLPRRGRAQDAVGDPRRRARRRHPRPAGGVRATRDRVLRRRPALACPESEFRWQSAGAW